MSRFSVPVVAAILILSPHLSLSAAGPPVDQDKLFPQPPPLGYILGYSNLDSDFWHDAGEPWTPAGTLDSFAFDYSCWMASASNLLVHAGNANPYLTWLGSGAAVSPNVSVWSQTYLADGGDAPSDSMTFDEGGWQDWALAFAGVPIDGPIMTVPEFGGAWVNLSGAPVDPVEWCRCRLDADIPVGLTCWWGDTSNYETKGPGPIDHDAIGEHWGYHAITLWDIGEGLLTITDSDDFMLDGQPLGTARTVAYSYTDGVWTIGLYTTVLNVTATVNYAVAILGEHPSAVGESSWGGVKTLFR